LISTEIQTGFQAKLFELFKSNKLINNKK